MTLETIEGALTFIICIGVFIIEVIFIKSIGKVLIEKLKNNRPLSEMKLEIGLVFSLIGVLIIFTGVLKYEHYRIFAALASFLNPLLYFAQK